MRALKLSLILKTETAQLTFCLTYREEQNQNHLIRGLVILCKVIITIIFLCCTPLKQKQCSLHFLLVCYFDALLQLTTDCLTCHGHGAILNKGVEATGGRVWDTVFWRQRQNYKRGLSLASPMPYSGLTSTLHHNYKSHPSSFIQTPPCTHACIHTHSVTHPYTHMYRLKLKTKVS